jgi:hypothetical protein
MILTGQYDSPFLRRVAVSLPLLGFARRHDTRSVFGAHRRALYPGRRRHGCAGNRDRSARILEARPAPITTAGMLRYLQMTDPDLALPKKYPSLAALSEHCESLPEFQATYPPDVVYPRSE